MAKPFMRVSKGVQVANHRRANNAIKMRGDDTFSLVFLTVTHLSVTTLVTPVCH